MSISKFAINHPIHGVLFNWIGRKIAFNLKCLNMRVIVQNSQTSANFINVLLVFGTEKNDMPDHVLRAAFSARPDWA